MSIRALAKNKCTHHMVGIKLQHLANTVNDQYVGTP